MTSVKQGPHFFSYRSKLIAVGAVSSCGKGAERFLRGLFSKHLVEIIKKKVPKATDIDFLRCGSFHSASPFLPWIENRGGGLGQNFSPQDGL